MPKVSEIEDFPNMNNSNISFVCDDYPNIRFDKCDYNYLLHSYPATILLGHAYSILLIIGFFGNSMMIYGILSNTEMHSTTNFLMANMAIADWLTIVICGPATMVFAIFRGK